MQILVWSGISCQFHGSDMVDKTSLTVIFITNQCNQYLTHYKISFTFNNNATSTLLQDYLYIYHQPMQLVPSDRITFILITNQCDQYLATDLPLYWSPTNATSTWLQDSHLTVRPDQPSSKYNSHPGEDKIWNRWDPQVRDNKIQTVRNLLLQTDLKGAVHS